MPKIRRMRSACLRERLHRAEQRDLGVQRLAGPADERGRNAEGDVVVAPHQERRAGGVPGGVAAGLERGADAARREARRVGLALHQLGPGEVEHHAAVAVGRGQRIVLLGGEPGERLEPVGVVGGAVLDRPVLHRGRHHVGHGRVERLPSVDGAEEAAVDLLGKALTHHRPGEDVAAEDRVDPLGRRAVGVEHAGGHRHTGGVGGGHGALRLAGWWWVRERAEHNHAARAGDTCRRSPITLARSSAETGPVTLLSVPGARHRVGVSAMIERCRSAPASLGSPPSSKWKPRRSIRAPGPQRRFA